MSKNQWKKFIEHWENGDYEEALNVQLEEQERGGLAVVDKLFRNSKALSATVVGISFIDILYDYMMINPVVIEAIDFARSEDLANFFTFQQFAEGFDFEKTGEITRLKGYTAEHLVALELQGKGHEVSFPETSNQHGYDLLVDGQPFQVKCLLEPSGVYEHFRKYPDIPVLVNEELASSLSNNPLVYGTEVSNQTVEEITRSTLKHTADLTELDIPLITLGVSSLTNGYRIITGGLSSRLGGLNIANETASRGFTGLIGKGAGLLIGPMFGPAGLVVMPIFIGFAGAYHGKTLSRAIKKIYTQKEREQVLYDLEILLSRVLEEIPEKEIRREKKFLNVKKQLETHSTMHHLCNQFIKKYREKQKYTKNKKDELSLYYKKIQEKTVNLETEPPHILDIVFKSQVHPYLYQKELTNLGESYKHLMKI